ncbi:MAG: hypothetical protein IJ646_08175 [Clostridia bacterium]|nr:hypothetical protein [Clostridia bacterium]
MVTFQMRFNTWDEFYRVREQLKPLNPVVGTVKKREYYSTAKFTIYKMPDPATHTATTDNTSTTEQS